MTDENKLEGQSRRKFLKTTGAVGVAATGVGAFGGQAAAQDSPSAVIRSVSRSIFRNRQQGQQGAVGLIVVQVQNVAAQITDVADVNVAIGGDVVDIGDINILNNNTIQIPITDVVDVTGNQVQVIVNLLGITAAGQNLGDVQATDTINVPQNV